MRSLSLALVSLGLAALAGAQTVTIPPGFATKEGGSYFYRLGNYRYVRQQAIYGSQLMPKAPLSIKVLKIRRDGTQHNRTYDGYKGNAEIMMSNNPLEPAKGYCHLWAHNHGKDLQTVMSKKVIDWPTTTFPTAPPAPFNVVFTLDKPFTYTGKAFVVEFITSKTNSADPDWSYWYPDGESTYVSGYYPTDGSRTTIGTGCPTDFTAYTTGSYTPNIGARFQFHGNTRVTGKSLPCLLAVGVTDKIWGSINLPFDLTGLGAPGCKVYNDIVIALAGTSQSSSSSGQVWFEDGKMHYPYEQNLVGCDIYAQIYAADPSYNALGLRLSHGNKLTIGSSYSVAMPGISFFLHKANWMPNMIYDHSWVYGPDRGSFVPILAVN